MYVLVVMGYLIKFVDIFLLINIKVKIVIKVIYKGLIK